MAARDMAGPDGSADSRLTARGQLADSGQRHGVSRGGGRSLLNVVAVVWGRRRRGQCVVVVVNRLSAGGESEAAAWRARPETERSLMSSTPRADPQQGARTDVVEALEREWPHLLPSLNARFPAWRMREPVVAAFPTAPLLLRALRSQRDRLLEDAILLALLREARQDRLAGWLVVQALLPGLKRAAGRILFQAGERDELWSLLLGNLWERIASYPLERRPRRVAANLLLDTIHGTLTALGRARRTAQMSEPLVSEELAPARREEEEVELLLARAVRAQAISREEAVLILRTRLEGLSLVTHARELGVSYDALRVRRRRAERRLLLFLGVADVRFGGRGRPLRLARVAGGGLAGSAGGGAVTHPSSRR